MIDSIERLLDLPIEEYEDALSILFINYSRLPRISVEYGEERRVIIDIINENPDALLTIKTALNKFESHIEKIKSISDTNRIQQSDQFIGDSN